MNDFNVKKLTFSLLLAMCMPMAAHATEIFNPADQVAHGKSIADKNNVKEQRKLELEIAILEDEIKKASGSDKAAIDKAVKKELAKIEKKHREEVISLNSHIIHLEKIKDDLESKLGKNDTGKNPFDDMYFVGMIQIGSSVKAEMIVDGSRGTYGVGEEISPGVKISSVSGNIVTLSSNGQSRKFPIRSSLKIADEMYANTRSKVMSEMQGGMGFSQQQGNLLEDMVPNNDPNE